MNTLLRTGYALLLALALWTVSHSATAQDYQRDRKRFHHAAYRQSTGRITSACRTVHRSMTQKKNRPVRNVKSWQSYLPQAEREPAQASVKTTPAPQQKTATITPVPTVKPTAGKTTFTPTPIVSRSELDKRHQKEDEVLKLNHLPAPSSEKHEEIRRLVANTLTRKTDTEPIELEPLYFTFDQDELAMVDMEPFLIAVEFGLQGKHILIEGHTDHQGADSYNVQLSIKRVQKIRELMIAMGVPDDQISVVGYGEEVTDHTDKTEEGKQQNRRVDFKAF